MAKAQQVSVPEWPRVRVNVSVMDQNDVPAVGVTAEALEITDDKVPAKDAVLRPVGDAPQSVCFVVDTSGSTYSQRNVIHAELVELIQKLPPQDEACLIDFEAQAFMDVPLTLDRAKLMDGLKALRSSGGSALFDAVATTARMLQTEAKNPRRVIVLVSDGGDNTSMMNEGGLHWILHAQGAPVVYSLANKGDRNAWEHHGEAILRGISELTGGREFRVNAEKDAVPAADGLLQAINGRYELEFTSSNTVRDDNQHTLRIALKKEFQKQKMEVVGPNGYVTEWQ